MTEQECLVKMIAPGQRRPNKPYRGGVIQVHVTRVCNRACFACTQGSNLTSNKPEFMPPEMFEDAIKSLQGYFGVYGVFGGNPATSPFFKDYCEILRNHVPRNQCGLWCNDPIKPENAIEMRKTFDPSISNLNVHLDRKAYDMFKQYWPESQPVGLETDSRHSPPFVAMKDVLRKVCSTCGGGGKNHILDRKTDTYTYEDCEDCHGMGKVYDKSRAWELISNCDVNQNWSAGMGMFRGQLRAWFCEIAMAQSILHQDNQKYPDTGVYIGPDQVQYQSAATEEIIHSRLKWWELGMSAFRNQVRKHCHECGIPLRGHGALAQGSDETQVEQVSETHKDIYTPKRKGRRVELVTVESQLGNRLGMVTKYLQNSRVK